MSKRKKTRSKNSINHVRYTDNSNVRSMLKHLFNDKDEFINYMLNCITVDLYNGEIGHVTISGEIRFDLNGWKSEEFFKERLKHSKAYFRKNRD